MLVEVFCGSWCWVEKHVLVILQMQGVLARAGVVLVLVLIAKCQDCTA
jgi:hypothetical protein